MNSLKDLFPNLCPPARRRPAVHYAGLVATIVRRRLRERPIHDFGHPTADEHQQNGLYGVHQIRVQLPGDPVQKTEG